MSLLKRQTRNDQDFNRRHNTSLKKQFVHGRKENLFPPTHKNAALSLSLISPPRKTGFSQKIIWFYSPIHLEQSPGGGGVLHYKFIRGCAPQGFLLRPNPRNLVRYCYPIPEYLTDIDTQSKKEQKQFDVKGIRD